MLCFPILCLAVIGVVLFYHLFSYSDDSNLDFGTIICALGVRYKSYCANIVRTLMVDPSDKQQKDYDFLLKVEEEILNKLQDGKIVRCEVFYHNSIECKQVCFGLCAYILIKVMCKVCLLHSAR